MHFEPKLIVYLLLGALLGAGGAYQFAYQPQVNEVKEQVTYSRGEFERLQEETTAQINAARSETARANAMLQTLQEQARVRVEAAINMGRSDLIATSQALAAEKDRTSELQAQIDQLQDQLQEAKSNPGAGVPGGTGTSSMVSSPTVPKPRAPALPPSWRSQMRDQINLLQAKLDAMKERRTKWSKTSSGGTFNGDVPSDLSDQAILELQSQIDRLAFQLN